MFLFILRLLYIIIIIWRNIPGISIYIFWYIFSTFFRWWQKLFSKNAILKSFLFPKRIAFLHNIIRNVLSAQKLFQRNNLFFFWIYVFINTFLNFLIMSILPQSGYFFLLTCNNGWDMFLSTQIKLEWQQSGRLRRCNHWRAALWLRHNSNACIVFIVDDPFLVAILLQEHLQSSYRTSPDSSRRLDSHSWWPCISFEFCKSVLGQRVNWIFVYCGWYSTTTIHRNTQRSKRSHCLGCKNLSDVVYIQVADTSRRQNVVVICLMLSMAKRNTNIAGWWLGFVSFTCKRNSEGKRCWGTGKINEFVLEWMYNMMDCELL